MGKPLLTDEILEKAKKKQYSDQSSQFGHYRPNQDISMDDALFDSCLEEDYQGYEEGQTIRIPVKPTVVKSRRIETIKREAFRSKVNKILFWVIILLIMFIIAVLFI
ncbi:cell wall synthase accessory phosphoprotein MacP [Streptococcus suis]